MVTTMQKMPALLPRTVYRFGHTAGGPLGWIILENGEIKLYSHPNEAKYLFDGEILSILHAKEYVTSTFRYGANIDTFIQYPRGGLYLTPALTLSPAHASTYKRAIFVNSLPKAGTYLVHRVLSQIGFDDVGLHLGDDGFHDNRGIPSSDIHMAPQSRRILCPAHAVTSLLKPGEFVVGHLIDRNEMDLVTASGVGVIHCVRDLRTALVSLFRFKRAKIAPISPGDVLWRTLTGRAAFKAFLISIQHLDIEYLRKSAEALAGHAGTTLRFEDISSGALTSDGRQALDLMEAGLGDRFSQELPRSIGNDTSTFIAGGSSIEDYWDADVEEFFISTGLDAANKAIGY